MKVVIDTRNEAMRAGLRLYLELAEREPRERRIMPETASLLRAELDARDRARVDEAATVELVR